LTSATSVTPTNCYGLVKYSNDLEERKFITEQRGVQQKNLSRELIQKFQSDSLSRELETLEGMCVIMH